MTESSIQMISSLRAVETGVSKAPAAYVQAPAAPAQAAPAAQAVEAAQPSARPAAQPEKAAAQADSLPLDVSSLSNVSLHFRVDDKTNDVTIFVVDRQSKKVLRAIPAAELQKMAVGELLKLTV